MTESGDSRCRPAWPREPPTDCRYTHRTYKGAHMLFPTRIFLNRKTNTHIDRAISACMYLHVRGRMCLNTNMIRIRFRIRVRTSRRCNLLLDSRSDCIDRLLRITLASYFCCVPHHSDNIHSKGCTYMSSRPRDRNVNVFFNSLMKGTRDVVHINGPNICFSSLWNVFRR